MESLGVLLDAEPYPRAFLNRLVKLAEQQDPTRQGRLIRRTRVYSVEEIMELVATEFKVDRGEYIGFRYTAPGRELAALVCRRFTSRTLAQLSRTFASAIPAARPA